MNYHFFFGIVLTVFNLQTPLQFVKAADNNDSLIESCSNTVQETNEDLKARYHANEFPDDPVTHCFVRCLALELHLYDDNNGVDLQANWEHLGKIGDENEFFTSNRACLEAKNLEMIEDLCDRAYSAYQCLMDDYNMIKNKENDTN